MKLSRRILIALSPLLLAAPVALAAASPAWATGTMCETNGPMNCVGSTGLAVLDKVKEANPPGRTLNWVPDGGHDWQGFPTGTLQFTGQSNRCLRLQDDDNAVVGTCSGTTGIVYGKSANNGQIYHNARLHSLSGLDYVLSGNGSVGSQMDGTDRNNPAGYFRFNGPG